MSEPHWCMLIDLHALTPPKNASRCTTCSTRKGNRFATLSIRWWTTATATGFPFPNKKEKYNQSFGFAHLIRSHFASSTSSTQVTSRRSSWTWTPQAQWRPVFVMASTLLREVFLDSGFRISFKSIPKTLPYPLNINHKINLFSCARRSCNFSRCFLTWCSPR